MQSRAGDTFYYSDLKSHSDDVISGKLGKKLVQKAIKNAFSLTDDKTYDIKLTLDSGHRDDPYMGYLSINADEQLVFTPKLRAGDNEVLGHYTGFLGLGWEEDLSLRNIMEMSSVLPDSLNNAVNDMIGSSVKFVSTP